MSYNPFGCYMIGLLSQCYTENVGKFTAPESVCKVHTSAVNTQFERQKNGSCDDRCRKCNKIILSRAYVLRKCCSTNV